jgi:hypothetical protein
VLAVQLVVFVVVLEVVVVVGDIMPAGRNGGGNTLAASLLSSDTLRPLFTIGISTRNFGRRLIVFLFSEH